MTDTTALLAKLGELDRLPTGADEYPAEVREIAAVARQAATAIRALEQRIAELERDRERLRAEVVFCSETFGLLAAPVPGDDRAIASHHAKRLSRVTVQWPFMHGKPYSATSSDAAQRSPESGTGSRGAEGGE